MKTHETARDLARAMTDALIAATHGRRDQRAAAAVAASEISFAATRVAPEFRPAFFYAAELGRALAAHPPSPTLCIDAAWAGAALARTVAGDRARAAAAMNEAVRSAMRRVRMAEQTVAWIVSAEPADDDSALRRRAALEEARRTRDDAVAVRRALLALGSALARALPGA